MSAREKLLGAKVPVERVYVRALDETYTLRGMTGAERDTFEASCFEGRGKKREFSMRNLRAKMVACCCIDEHGKRIFSDEDAVALGEARADVIDQLFSVAQRLSGLREEDSEELGLSSATPTPSAISSSASPLN
jgi:hypothetical protein